MLLVNLYLKMWSLIVLVSDGNTDKSIFCFSTTQNFWLKFECRNSNTSKTFPLLAVKLGTIHKPANLPINDSNHPENSQTTNKPTKYLKNEAVISKKFPPSFHESIVYD